MATKKHKRATREQHPNSVGRPWPKGVSGNPGGRGVEVGLQEVKEYAKIYTKESCDRLAYWMRSKYPVASVRAAEALLNRAWGYPAQEITAAPGSNGISITVRHIVDGKDVETTKTIEHKP